MSPLTTTACTFRMLSMPKKKAGRAHTSELTKRTVASTLKRPFLRLKFIVKLAPLFGCCIRAEASKVVEGGALVGMEQSLFRGVKLCAAPTIFASHRNVGYLKPTKVQAMTDKKQAFVPESCFKIDPTVDQTKLYDPIYLALERAQALLSLMQTNGECLTEGFTVPHSVVMYSLDGIDASLSQAKTLIESQQVAQLQAGEANA